MCGIIKYLHVYISINEYLHIEIIMMLKLFL